jgi:succinate-semialdehyde dehydrogenase / glutarate-semialdehyde dehydrogenase
LIFSEPDPTLTLPLPGEGTVPPPGKGEARKGSSFFKKHQLFINGKWCDANNSASFSVINPANEKMITSVADATEVDATLAIESADQAFAAWQKTSAKDRSRLLRKWFDLVIQHQEELAKLITQESGKPLAEARAEVLYAASYIEWFSEEAKRSYGDIIPSDNNKSLRVIKQPIGVVALITPWNFPIAMLARKMAPALAAGCTLVAKPAAETPLTALALFELAEQAGFPPGVINCVISTQSALIGKIFTTDLRVRKISFTGSTAVGKQLIAQSANSVKRLSMELGGNAPFIVCDDANIDAAVDGAMQSKFRNAGQTCVCANRFYVQQKNYDEFVQKMANRMSKLVPGNGLDNGVTLGPLISEKARQKVTGLIEQAISEGARIYYQLPLKNITSGFFMSPTLLVDIKPDAKILSEEIFGPVVSVCVFDTDEKLFQWVNASEYGLSAYVYSQNPARIHQLTQQIQTGMIGVNTGIISNEMAPFGGIKESGWGREGSRYGLDDYLSTKYICEEF